MHYWYFFLLIFITTALFCLYFVVCQWGNKIFSDSKFMFEADRKRVRATKENESSIFSALTHGKLHVDYLTAKINEILHHWHTSFLFICCVTMFSLCCVQGKIIKKKMCSRKKGLCVQGNIKKEKQWRQERKRTMPNHRKQARQK